MPSDRLILKNSAYLLPNMMAAFNLICGLIAIILALETYANHGIDSKYNLSAWLLLSAMVFDFLDGKVARWTHTESQFGVKIDSLTDFVSFGVAPMIIAYTALLDHADPLLRPIPCVLFLFGGAWRLARFNCEAQDCGSSTHFKGLPIPAAAVFVCAIVLVNKGPAESIAPKLLGRAFTSFSPELSSNLAMLVITVLAFLMVSHIPFPSFKRINRKNMIILSGVALFFAVLSFLLPFENIVFLIMLLYLFIGLFHYFLNQVIQQYTRVRK